MREADEEIREIKKEIIESRGLIIKTNNLTNSLAADIKSIAKRQAGYERHSKWNSASAYVLFAVLAFAGLKCASDARIGELAAEHKGLEREVEELREEVAQEARRTEERARGESRASQYYQLVRQQKRREVVDGYEALQKEQLSPAEAAFFRDVVERFRLDLSVAAYQAGLDLIRTGRYAEAAESLQAALRMHEAAPHAPAVKYNLARALRRLDRQAEAIVLLQTVVDQNVDRELQDDAALLLAQCAQDEGQVDDARNAVKLLLRRFPHSALAPDARQMLADLNRRARTTATPSP